MNVIMHTFISYWLFEILTNMTHGFCGFFFFIFVRYSYRLKTSLNRKVLALKKMTFLFKFGRVSRYPLLRFIWKIVRHPYIYVIWI